MTAAALCVKPRGQMTARQIVNVDALKTALAKFTTMRHLAMRFRGLLRGGTRERLDIWLNDAGKCGVYAPVSRSRGVPAHLLSSRCRSRCFRYP